MPTKWEMIAARKRQKKQDEAGNLHKAWQVWRTCQVCRQSYCANNYSDRRVRIHRWRGVEFCAFCRYNLLKYLPRLEKLGVIKLKRSKKSADLSSIPGRSGERKRSGQGKVRKAKGGGASDS